MIDLKNIRRKSVNFTPENLIKTEFIEQNKQLILVIKPTISELDLINWVVNNRSWIENKLLKYGCLLFRYFQLDYQTEFEQFIQAISGELVDYSYRSTPRTLVNGKIYTSTEYPAEQFIPLHNEMSYARNWPMKIWFYCVEPAGKGGETPIADSRRVFNKIPAQIKARFIDQKVMYVRNYGKGLDLDWQNVFQTNNKSAVESYCRQAEIEFEWIGENHLRTRQVCQAVATHPTTKEIVWFNQAHLFHVASLPFKIRKSLLSMMSEQDLPRNAFYGDETPIEDSIIEEINDIYRQEAITFPWQAGDILMLDNMLFAHGRNPFLGSRKVLVGMAGH
ncbi:MAG TPA: TauD/TfdA family dioxygenase [Coleofasciculaceae cyanobacterium]|jgi:alpha-ketoglutarate-dependent taurine dioxygenase